MHEEFRIMGPPGTGKTTYLARQIEHAAEKNGPENIIVASYTKAAATELNRRELPIPRENIGTIHALCYRNLRGYEIAEINAQSFNEQHPQYSISIAGTSSNMDEMAVDAVFQTEGDKYLNEYNLFRAKCLNLSAMHKDTIKWVKKWESWKLNNKFIDFTDMISITLCMDEPMAGNPRIGFFDECQDFSQLEMNLVRHWAKYQDRILLCGDDDQCIYTFTGATPDAFLDPTIPVANKRVLNQSWRLPRKIHEYSQKWIKQIKNREPKEFNPKAEEGQVCRIQSNYRSPEKAIELAARYTQDGKDVMLLASCGYLLNHVKTVLRKEGLPYHNPYRSTRGDWNPMGNFKKDKTNRISTRERIISFLGETTAQGYWDLQSLDRWSDLLKVKGVFKKGAKERIAAMLDNPYAVITDEAGFYAEIFEPFALEMAMKRDVAWFRESMLAAKRSASDYPLAVYGKCGLAALEEKPKITIGTIHSVKGGEASVVFLFPDISLAAYGEYEKSPDSVIRTFYVGMTRAKETLILCEPYSNISVKLN